MRPKVSIRAAAIIPVASPFNSIPLRSKPGALFPRGGCGDDDGGDGSGDSLCRALPGCRCAALMVLNISVLVGADKACR